MTETVTCDLCPFTQTAETWQDAMVTAAEHYKNAHTTPTMLRLRLTFEELRPGDRIVGIAPEDTFLIDRPRTKTPITGATTSPLDQVDLGALTVSHV